jgi:hypothetical protein
MAEVLVPEELKQNSISMAVLVIESYSNPDLKNFFNGFKNAAVWQRLFTHEFAFYKIINHEDYYYIPLGDFY